MSEEEKPSKKEIDIEIEKIRSETGKYVADKISETVFRLIDAFREYYLKTARITLFAAWIIVGLIFSATACLTYLGKVGGETFSFVAGTIVG